MTLRYVSGWTCREVHRVAKLSSRNVTPAFLYSVRQHAQKSMALSASSASVEVSWAFCGWLCHSLFATLWTQGFLRRSRKIDMHHWNASAKKPLHYILEIFPRKGSIGSWVTDLPVTHFQDNFWLLNPLIFIPSQNPLRISLIHALYTSVNFLRANGGGTKPPDPVLQLCGLCNSPDLIVCLSDSKNSTSISIIPDTIFCLMLPLQYMISLSEYIPFYTVILL